MAKPKRPTETPRPSPQAEAPEDFSRFEDLAKKLVGVPKEEIDAERAKEKKKNKKKKKKKT